MAVRLQAAGHDLANVLKRLDRPAVSGGIPSFNFDRAQTAASIDRLKKLAANLKATVVIQHDMRDIEKLPAFPAAAK